MNMPARRMPSQQLSTLLLSGLAMALSTSCGVGDVQEDRDTQPPQSSSDISTTNASAEMLRQSTELQRVLTELSDTRSQLAKQTDEIQVLVGRLRAAENKIDIVRNVIGRALDRGTMAAPAFQITPAELSVGGSGFSIASAGPWTLLVSLKDVQPIADGQRITLRVGNPYNADLSGVVLELRYGRRAPSVPELDDKLGTASEWQAWKDGLKTYTQSVPDPLLGGQWTEIAFPIAPAAADEVGFLGVTLRVAQVSLQR